MGETMAEPEIDDLGDILSRMTDILTHPDRPFTGQPHTDQGERGKTEVKGIRFRDLADCVVRALVDCNVSRLIDEDAKLGWELHGRAEDGTLNYNDVFKLPIEGMDPLALVQTVCCQVEKAMGIFPNLPGTEPNSTRSEK